MTSNVQPLTNITDTMFTKAKAAMTNAYAPYSQFHVGCCLRTADDTLYSGCNIENVSYSLTQCAEASTIAAMVSHGQQQIKEVVIIADSDRLVAPCGACRQRILEFAELTTPIHLANSEAIGKTMTLGQLLPEAFGPDNMSRSKEIS